jgi:multimeric flavodoxin WrbA
MKKILGIIGSKRSSGNCEVMAKEISRQVPEPHQLTLLRLPEFNLSYCTGCYRCLIKNQGCVLKDDLAIVLGAIADADGLILTAPTYFLSGHSSLKVFIERGISFYSLSDSLWGKPAIGAGIAGLEGKEGSTLLDIERFFSALLAENKQSRIVYGALPGEVMLNQKNKEIAAELGRNLFGQRKPKEGLCCQLCGGETFRFMDGNRVRCMLCSDEGTWAVKNNQLVLGIVAGEHEFLSDKKQALKHRDWLLGMVGRFQESKEKLKEIAAEYENDGLWIRPDRERRSLE